MPLDVARHEQAIISKITKTICSLGLHDIMGSIWKLPRTSSERNLAGLVRSRPSRCHVRLYTSQSLYTTDLKPTLKRVSRYAELTEQDAQFFKEQLSRPSAIV